MYVVLNDQIIHETIDGETMIVNLIDGSYYNSAGTGAFLWAVLIRGNSIEDCVNACQKQYQCNSVVQLDNEVKGFVAQLLKDGLIREATSKDISELASQEVDAQKLVVENPAEFAAPVLHKYSDMQDLLLLDPIHDVDDSGWPHPKSGVL